MPILQMTEPEEEEVVVNFLELIQTLLKDPEERRDFFLVRRYHIHICGARFSCKCYLLLHTFSCLWNLAGYINCKETDLEI